MAFTGVVAVTEKCVARVCTVTEPPVVPPVRVLSGSLALTVWAPGVSKVKLKVVGVGTVVSAGNVAEPSLLVKCTVSVKPEAGLLSLS
jgi:hypothetical protein